MKHTKVQRLRSLRAEMKAVARGEKAAADTRAEYEFDYREAVGDLGRESIGRILRSSAANRS